MKYGIREICDVVLKAKAEQTVGSKKFKANEPVLYFDTLKTSTMEGAATTVYAQGGRGNSRLIAWEGERTVTFTMEDALISPIGFSILSGAGLIEAGDGAKIVVHVAETATAGDDGKITVKKKVYNNDDIDGSEIYVMKLTDKGDIDGAPIAATLNTGDTTETISAEGITKGDMVLVDYYTEVDSDAQQIEITPDKFGGNYYLEASTLFRDQNGVDHPAEFIIPNCKIQSNFTFTMASSGDPSTFTFTMDAFPDYLRFGSKKEKVLAAIQIIEKKDE